MMESVGSAPTSTCLQVLAHGHSVHYLSATTPERIYDLRFRICDLAGRRGAAPRTLSFGDSTAQAGARPVLNSDFRIPSAESNDHERERFETKNQAICARCHWILRISPQRRNIQDTGAAIA